MKLYDSLKRHLDDSLTISQEAKQLFININKKDNLKNNLISARNREEFVRSLSHQEYPLSHSGYQDILNRICEDFLNRMQDISKKGERFTNQEIETAKIFLEWAKLQTIVLPSSVTTPFLNIYHAGKRVVTFSPHIHKREDIEIPFRNKRSNTEKPIDLFVREEDREEGIAKLRRIGLQKELDPNGRKSLRYSDIPNPTSFCEFLDWVAGKIESETYEIQQFKDEVDLISESTSLGEETFDYGSFRDARKYIETSIVLRQGQPKLRQKLIGVYRRCIVTGYGVEDVLEAAHIHPYQGEATNIIENGLLLRADIHTLFDRYLLTINPDTDTTRIAPQLLNTEYRVLENKSLDLALKLVADRDLLKQHYLIAMGKWKAK